MRTHSGEIDPIFSVHIQCTYTISTPHVQLFMYQILMSILKPYVSQFCGSYVHNDTIFLSQLVGGEGWLRNSI